MSGLHGKLHGLDEAVGGGGGGGAVAQGVTFRLNGDISLVTPSAANAYAGDGIFDGQPAVTEAVTLTQVTLWQRLDGASGSTTVELYYWNSVTWTEIALAAALTLAAGGGDNAEITVAFSAPLALLAGYRLGVQLTAVQSAGGGDVPTDVVVTVAP